MTTSTVGGEVRVGSEGRRVVVHVTGRLERDFAHLLGDGLAAAVDELRPVMIDVNHVESSDIEVLRAVGCLIGVVTAAGHDVAVRGASEALRGYLRPRHRVTFVTQP